MSDSGSDQLNNDSSTSTFTSAIWYNAAIGLGCFGAFALLRRRRQTVYYPRSELAKKEHQPPSLPNRYSPWIVQILRLPDEELIRIMGLDRYMILRFLRMGMVVFTLFSLIALPILIPINIVNQLNLNGINKLSMGNVKDSNRLWAHLFLSVFLTAGVIYYTFIETRKYIQLRQAYLTSPEFARTIKARTLYVAGIPPSINNVESLTKIFNCFPGAVRRIWITRDMATLPKMVAERQKDVEQLEGAITSVILNAYKHTAKKKQAAEDLQSTEKIPAKLRPTHRVSRLPIALPCFGQKVDSISYYINEIRSLNGKIHHMQTSPGELNKLSSAFIEFHQPIGMHMAAQCILHSKILQMEPRYIQVAPNDVIWENMDISTTSRMVRRTISYIITGAIVILWAFPVAFIQAIANLHTLSTLLPFLKPLDWIPPTAVGIIQGVLPPAALAILVMLVPVVFSYLSTFEGIPQKSRVNLAVLDKFFAFLYVNVLIVSTISGGVFSSISALLHNPVSIIHTLSECLPKASVFFITYVIMQGINGCGQVMLQVGPLALSYVFPFLAKTPRQIYMQRSLCPPLDLGSLMPTHTVIFILGLEYSVISPIILPFVCIFFYLSYFVYLYQFLYVYEMDFETGGLGFPRSVRHIYVGMFTWHLTMIGLYAVRGNAIGQLVIMVVVLVASVIALGLYDIIFKPLLKFMPVEYHQTGLHEKHNHGPDSPDQKPTEDKAELGHGIGYQMLTKEEYDACHRKDTSTTIVEDLPNLGDIDAYRLREQQLINIEQQILRTETRSGHANDQEDASSFRLLYESETYMHPSLYQPQPTVWLPHDELGISKKEVNRLQRLNIRSSNYGARVVRVKNKGKVVLEDDKVLLEGKGIPKEPPGPDDPSRIHDYIRSVIDDYKNANTTTLQN